ncbi:MAG: RluA family pseudouridine synthase [Verrucomicrobiota bacterium]
MAGIIKLSAPATRQFWEIPVLFEDEHLLALDKPSHLLTSPDRYDPDRPNLMKLLHRDIARGAGWARERGIAYLANAHRLDFETSGIILLAKNKPALVALANLFGSEKPLKKYIALVHGEPATDAFVISKKLGPHPVKIGLVRIDEKRGKKAATELKVLERYGRYTLLECQPLTGRTHQIRVHLQSVRLPIAGDALYGGKPLLLSRLKPDYRPKRDVPEKPLLARVGLHAAGLILPHPVTAAPVEIVSPWPNDLAVAVKYLRRYLGPGRSAVGQQLDQADSHHDRG